MNEQKLTTVGEYAYKQSRTRDFLKRYGMALVFIAPHLIFFLAFCIYPLIYGIIMSLFKYNIADPSQNEWRGFGNFITILFKADNIYHKEFLSLIHI